MTSPTPSLSDLVRPDENRVEFWSRVINARGLRDVAEIGVWKGEFAEAVLSRCPEIGTYLMVDPWRHLDDWNKPANADDASFDDYYQLVLERTSPWAAKRSVLRGRTTEVIHEVPDESLDFAYIDGDHSLRGITIDLLGIWPKVRSGGIVGGDDFSRSVWQHPDSFEPTFVFPFAVYYAEALAVPVEALPRNQFALHKTNTGFSFTDHTGRYGDLTVRGALRGRKRSNHPTATAQQPTREPSTLDKVRGRIGRR
jgi:hypothetical protein